MTITLILVGLVLIGIGHWGWRQVAAVSRGRTDPALRQRVAVLRRGAVACHAMGALLVAVGVVPLI